MIANGYELAELSGRAEADDPSLVFQPYPPNAPGINNVAATFRGMLAWRVNKAWGEDTDKSAAIAELLRPLNPPTITIPNHSVVYVLRFPYMVRAATVPKFGGEIVAPEYGILVSGLIAILHHGISRVQWADPESLRPIDAPDQLLERLDSAGLIYPALA